MKYLWIISLAIMTICIIACQKQQLESVNKVSNSLLSNHRNIDTADFELYNGRIVFKDVTAWIDVVNNWDDADSMNIFHDIIEAKGTYTPWSYFSTYFTEDSTDHLNGYFLNEDHVYQVDTFIFWVNLDTYEMRSISVNDESELYEILISGQNNDRINVQPLEATETQRSYAACFYCAFAAGMVGSGIGIVPGLLELYSCYSCWANW